MRTGLGTTTVWWPWALPSGRSRKTKQIFVETAEAFGLAAEHFAMLESCLRANTAELGGQWLPDPEGDGAYYFGPSDDPLAAATFESVGAYLLQRPTTRLSEKLGRQKRDPRRR